MATAYYRCTDSSSTRNIWEVTCIDGIYCHKRLQCKNNTCVQQPITGVPTPPAPGNLGGACIDGIYCHKRLQCKNNTCVQQPITGVPTPPAPGNLGGACIDGIYCYKGLQCKNNTCVQHPITGVPTPPAPGNLGSPCIHGLYCNKRLQCKNNTCVQQPITGVPTPPAPGNLGSACIHGLYCNGGLKCKNNTCVQEHPPGIQGCIRNKNWQPPTCGVLNSKPTCEARQLRRERPCQWVDSRENYESSKLKDLGVIFYGTKFCGYCGAAKKDLKDAGEFKNVTYKDVSDKAHQKEMKNYGGPGGVPYFYSTATKKSHVGKPKSVAELVSKLS